MGMRGTGLSLGLLQTIDRKQKEYQNLQVARQDQQMKREKWDLEKQKYQADIELKKRAGELSSAQAQSLNEALKNQEKVMKAQYDQSRSMIDQQENQHAVEAKKINALAQHLEKKQRVYHDKYRTSSDGKITRDFGYVEKPISQGGSQKVTEIDKILGELQLGRYDSLSGEYIPFESRGDMKKYAIQKLGYNWKTKVPDAKKIIDEKFPPPEPKVKVISPSGVPGYIPKSKLEEAKKRGFTVEQ